MKYSIRFADWGSPDDGFNAPASMSKFPLSPWLYDALHMMTSHVGECHFVLSYYGTLAYWPMISSNKYKSSAACLRAGASHYGDNAMASCWLSFSSHGNMITAITIKAYISHSISKPLRWRQPSEFSYRYSTITARGSDSVKKHFSPIRLALHALILMNNCRRLRGCEALRSFQFPSTQW